MAGLFLSGVGWYISRAKHLLVPMFRISNPLICAGETPWVMEEVFVEKSRGQLLAGSSQQV